jgi:hypothetical protein
MAQVLIRALGPEDWKRYLAQPNRHWKKGYSAWALAHSWHRRQGFPEEVSRVFLSSGIKVMEGLEPLLILPEHKVPLPGGGTPSQSDIWVLGRSGDDLASITVEGKVQESFGSTLGRWLEGGSAGKRRRLDFLVDVLGLPHVPPGDTRYQLVHRTASALLEAKNFVATHAMMMVHSFSETDDGFDDYASFVSLFGANPQVNGVASAGRRNGVELYFAWVRGNRRWLDA